MQLETFIEGHQFGGFYFPINFRVSVVSHSPGYIPAQSGVHLDFQKLSGWVGVQSLGDFQDLLARLVMVAAMPECVSRYNAFPRYVDQVIKMMKSGMEKNMTNHALSMEVKKHLKIPMIFQGVDEQINGHLEGDVATSVFYKPFLDIHSNISQQHQDSLRAQARDVILTKLRPTLVLLGQFLRERYLPACRPEIAASSLPGGRFYDACIRFLLLL